MSATLSQARAGIVGRLRARRPEIEQAMLARVYGVSEAPSEVDPEYMHGLRAAVSAAVDHALEVVEREGEHAPQIPVALLAQARLAARNGIPLDIVLRRYFSGFNLFIDFVMQEAEPELPLSGTSLHRFLQAQSSQLDRLIAEISEEYAREEQLRAGERDGRRVKLVKRLLAGEPIDVSALNHELSGWHVAVVLSGEDPAVNLRAIAERLDRLLLLVRPREGATWAWLTGRRWIDSERVMEQIRLASVSGTSAAVGEPGQGLAGWRLSHWQAETALPMAPHRGEPLVRYAEVGLLASTLRDEVLVASLRQMYLAPLEAEHDCGQALMETLRAYFASSRNLTSTAARLKASRQTVRTRLRTIETKIGRPLNDCAADIDLALRIDALDGPAAPVHQTEPKSLRSQFG